MKSLFPVLALALTVPALPVLAGPIETTCNRSDRPAANPVLCSCIQSMANQTLSRADQRKAARFFRDPDLAQEVRMSPTADDNAFWGRYRAFGDAAGQRCAF